MALKEKYAELIDFATNSGCTDMQVTEQDEILYVTCTAPGKDTKEGIWQIYDRIDPDMRSGDLVLNVTVDTTAEPEIYDVKPGDNLTKIARKYEGVSWKDIWAANRDILKHPDKIYIGQKLKIPR